MPFPWNRDGYRLLNNFPVSRLPVRVSSAQAQGLADLYRPEYGGGAAPSYVRHVFDGERYVEAERLPSEPAPSEMPVLAEDYTFEDGIPLAPTQ